jgi:hypothetical protein
MSNTPERLLSGSQFGIADLIASDPADQQVPKSRLLGLAMRSPQTEYFRCNRVMSAMYVRDLPGFVPQAEGELSCDKNRARNGSKPNTEGQCLMPVEKGLETKGMTIAIPVDKHNFVIAQRPAILRAGVADRDSK